MALILRAGVRHSRGIKLTRAAAAAAPAARRGKNTFAACMNRLARWLPSRRKTPTRRRRASSTRRLAARSFSIWSSAAETSPRSWLTTATSIANATLATFALNVPIRHHSSSTSAYFECMTTPWYSQSSSPAAIQPRYRAPAAAWMNGKSETPGTMISTSTPRRAAFTNSSSRMGGG